MNFFEQRLAKRMHNPEFREGYLEAYAEALNRYKFEVALSADGVEIYAPARTEYTVCIDAPSVAVADQQAVVAPQAYGAAVA